MTSTTINVKGKNVTATVVSIDLATVKSTFETTSYAGCGEVETTVRLECEGRSSTHVFHALVGRNGFVIGSLITRRWNKLAASMAEAAGVPVAITGDLDDDGDLVMKFSDQVEAMASGLDARTIGEVVAEEDLAPAALDLRFETNLAAAQKGMGNDPDDQEDVFYFHVLDEEGNVGFEISQKDFATGTLTVEFVGDDGFFEERTIRAEPFALAADPMRFVREAFATI